MGLSMMEELRRRDQIGDGFERRDQTGEAVGWGLGCGEIGVGLVGFIGDGFEDDGEAEAAQSDRRWV